MFAIRIRQHHESSLKFGLVSVPILSYIYIEPDVMSANKSMELSEVPLLKNIAINLLLLAHNCKHGAK